jgi:hypothetical protein
MTKLNRLTIIPVDGFCSVEGDGYIGIDMVSVPADVHAIQWYGTHGEVEIKDPLTGKLVRNEFITDLSAYQSVIASYWATRNAVEESQAAAMANDQIVEV